MVSIKRGDLVSAAASIIVGVALIAGLEVGARVLAHRSSAANPAADVDELFDYSETLGWELRPDARATVLGAVTTINAHGWRGEAPKTRLPAPGVTRVVLLGDSVAFGYGVADDKTFAQRLDAENDSVEVVNLAVPGYGIDQSLLRYEGEGRSWHPGVVVLSLCVDNDLADVMLPVSLYDGRHPKPQFFLQDDDLQLQDRHVRLRPRMRVGNWLQKNSALVRRLTRRGRPVFEVDKTRHWSARKASATSDEDAAVSLVAALVGRLRSTVEADGGRLVLSIHPNKFGYRHGSRWVTSLLEAPEALGLDVVYLDHEYHHDELGFGKFTLDDIGHLNDTGHRLTAEALRIVLTD